MKKEELKVWKILKIIPIVKFDEQVIRILNY
jgi:hypothetical protein